MATSIDKTVAEEKEYVVGERSSTSMMGNDGIAKGRHSKPHEVGGVRKYKHERLRIEDNTIIPPPITPPRSQYGHCFQFQRMLSIVSLSIYRFGSDRRRSNSLVPKDLPMQWSPRQTS